MEFNITNLKTEIPGNPCCLNEYILFTPGDGHRPCDSLAHAKTLGLRYGGIIFKNIHFGGVKDTSSALVCEIKPAPKKFQFKRHDTNTCCVDDCDKCAKVWGRCCECDTILYEKVAIECVSNDEGDEKCLCMDCWTADEFDLRCEGYMPQEERYGMDNGRFVECDECGLIHSSDYACPDGKMTQFYISWRK